MKTKKIVLLVVWLCVAALLIAVLAVGMALDFSGFSFGIYSYRYDDADLYQAGDVNIGEPVTELDIEWTRGSVSIETYDGDTVFVSEDGNYTGDMQLRTRYHNGKLSIRYCKSKVYWGFTAYPVKVLTVKVPESMAQSLTDLSFESVAADFEADRITAERLSVEQVSGDVTLNEVCADMIDLEAVSSRVLLDGTFGSLHIEMVSGDCYITDHVMPAEIDYESVSGDAELLIADGDGFAASFEKVSGEFFCSFPATYVDEKYVYDDGLARYDFETVSGDVNIRQLVSE